MKYKKLFFPIGGGEELKERFHGALLITKYFNAHLEILKSQATPSQIMVIDENLPETVLKELNTIAAHQQLKDLFKHETIFKDELKKIDITNSKIVIKDTPSAQIITAEGYRSKLIEEHSKFCDLVIVSSPDEGRLTATFETTVTKSGKPALMFPRKMTKFSTDNIIIGWNNSAEVSRAVTEAIPILQKAKKVHIITTKEFTHNVKQIEKLLSYLEVHDIKASYEIVKTTKIPGEALLKNAKGGNFDLIIAGAFGHRGLRELMLGGTTKYILEHSDIPIFMAH